MYSYVWQGQILTTEHTCTRTYDKDKHIATRHTYTRTYDKDNTLQLNTHVFVRMTRTNTSQLDNKSVLIKGLSL